MLTNVSLIAISQVGVGDSVWAYNPGTGERALKRVSHTFTYQRDTVYRIGGANNRSGIVIVERGLAVTAAAE